MSNIKNLSNEYSAVLGSALDDIPKTVLAAIAVSALTSGGDCLENALSLVIGEWDILFANGIVPQKVPTKYRAFLPQAKGE